MGCKLVPGINNKYIVLCGRCLPSSFCAPVDGPRWRYLYFVCRNGTQIGVLLKRVRDTKKCAKATKGDERRRSSTYSALYP